jgi:hypothetical protein
MKGSLIADNYVENLITPLAGHITFLHEIDFSYNEIGDVGAKAIAGYLKVSFVECLQCIAHTMSVWRFLFFLLRVANDAFLDSFTFLLGRPLPSNIPLKVEQHWSGRRCRVGTGINDQWLPFDIWYQLQRHRYWRWDAFRVHVAGKPSDVIRFIFSFLATYQLILHNSK